ncbi:unnamed protein product [Meganyctiphanes norvegica]|uniref:BTB domain-containing protein n=1 Tax=Meganyctiphanes norvegica TaxID=48144 RepID=A0AAV2S2I7_MEGNR
MTEMEVCEFRGEVQYTISVPKWSSYTDFRQVFSSDIEVVCNRLRSRWHMTLTPFELDPENRHKSEEECTDVSLRLQCLECNIHLPNIDIYCGIHGREEHETRLKKSNDGLEYSGIITSRISIKVLKLLVEDTLVTYLRFAFSEDDLLRSVGGIEEVGNDLRYLLENDKDSDVCLITSDGTELPVHSAILRTRSTLLNTAKPFQDITNRNSVSTSNSEVNKREENYMSEINLSNTSEQAKSINNQQNKSSRESTASSVTSDYHSMNFSLSPDSSNSSVRSNNNKRYLHQEQVSPNKRIFSPSVSSSPSRKCYSPTSRALTSDTPLFKVSKKETPVRRLYTEDKKQEDMSEYNKSVTPKKKELMSSFGRERTALKETCQTKQLSNDSEMRAKQKKILKVNMSTSVTQRMLEWMYTGRCSSLSDLVKPLLVAGLRHGIPGLVKACEQHLVAALTPENAADTLILAHKYQVENLQEKTLAFALDHAQQVTIQPSWASLATRSASLVLEFSKRLAQYSCSPVSRSHITQKDGFHGSPKIHSSQSPRRSPYVGASKSPYKHSPSCSRKTTPTSIDLKSGKRFHFSRANF